MKSERKCDVGRERADGSGSRRRKVFSLSGWMVLAGGGRLADGEAFGVGGSVGWRPKDVVAGGGYEEHTVFRRGAAPENIRTVRTAGNSSVELIGGNVFLSVF